MRKSRRNYRKNSKKNYLYLAVLAVLAAVWVITAVQEQQEAQRQAQQIQMEAQGGGTSGQQGGSVQESGAAQQQGGSMQGSEASSLPGEGWQAFSLDTLPAYSELPYYVVNDNMPYFQESEKNTEVFEYYSELDELGRCGVAYANICKELMPTEERGDIGSVKPTGWVSVKYDHVDGKYLYNRCHLIGFQLAGENANKKNLITGTRYMNVEGMLPFENMVDDYVDETGHHVLYRVTPFYDGDDLVAAGVLMEAWSVEDAGEGICFNVFCYNVQPGVSINYADGSSTLLGTVTYNPGK